MALRYADTSPPPGRGRSPGRRRHAIGYVLEWSRGGARRRSHMIASADELRAELAAGEARGGGSGRMLVVRGGSLAPSAAGDEVAAALCSAGGVDAEFLSRPRTLGGIPAATRRGLRRAARVACWWDPGSRDRHGTALVSLWTTAYVPILIIDDDAMPEWKAGSSRRHDLPTDRGSSARRSTAYTPQPQPTQRHGNQPPTSTTCRASSLEEDLWDALCWARGDASVQELVAELVYDRWIDWLAGLDPDDADGGVWAAVAALEANLDEARSRARVDRGALDGAGPGAWADLVQRLHARAHYRQQRALLASSSRAPAPPPPLSSTDVAAAAETERTLNRIAYLGGMLLPVSVVASVLAIGGPFGPRGDRFWVFWAAGVGASLAALVVIYADRLRSLEVWLEVDADAETQQQQEEEEEAWRRRVLVQRWADGRRGRTWRRAELGWGGAAKKMAGYYRWRGTSRVRFARPSEVLRTETWSGGG